MGGMSTDSPRAFRERLWPSPWLLITLLLLVPAVTLTITPVNAGIALPTAIAVYLLVAGSLVVMSPVIEVSGKGLTAGGARVPLSALGESELLGDTALRRLIGPEADARAYLLVRGYIHRGVRIDIVDDEDPTPYWVLTSRKPKELAEAIRAAKQA